MENGVRRANRGLIIATTTAVPESTASDREGNQIQFKEDLRTRYCCIHLTNPNLTKCMVLNHFFSSDVVTAGHLVSLTDRHIAPLLGFSSVWDEKNGILVYKPLDVKYGSLELTYVPNPNSHQIVLRVLYDSLLNTELLPKVRRSVVGIAGEGNVTYGDINGRALQLPTLTYPYRRAFLRHAISSYKLMADSKKSHNVGELNSPSEEEWDELAVYCKDESPGCSDSEFFSAHFMSTDVD